jgi:glycosyltransferase involved in cell wall biosynthesis
MTGVNVAGYFHAEVGVGEAGRLLLTGLKAAGIPYAVVPFRNVPSRQRSPFMDEGTGKPTYDINIVSVNADALPPFIQEFGWEFFENRYTVGMWWWEVEEFPEYMRRAADFVDEVWVGSRHTAEAIAPVIDKPVLINPPPIVPLRPAPMSREALGLPEGYLFLFAFDFNSVIERKNPLGAIDAFKKAFEPNEGPTLILKSVNGFQHQKQLEALRTHVGERQDIQIRDEYMDLHVLHALMSSCDAYVSLHRAEGFGLTMAESMALGKPVIATGYGGNLEFMTHRNSYLVDYSLTEIPPGCDPYPAGARWAQPKVDDAADYFRRVYEDRVGASEVAKRGRSEVLTLHAPEARVRFLQTRLCTIRDSLMRARPGHRTQLESLGVAPSGQLVSTADIASALSTAPGSAIKRLPRRFLGLALLPALHRQTIFNSTAARILGDVTGTVSRERRKLAALEEEVADLRRTVEGDGVVARR